MQNTCLEFIQGDTETRKIQIKINNTTPNIAGWLIFFTAKTDYNDADIDAIISVTYTVPDNADAHNGITYLILPPATTNVAIGKYHYDLKYQSTERITIARGTLTIIPTITQRTS